MEKNIEIWIGRCFTRWGTRWTRPAAHYLLKLRLRTYRWGSKWFEALNALQLQLTKA